MTVRESTHDNRCPGCGAHALLREDDRDFCLLCPWEREHEQRRSYPTLDLSALLGADDDASDAA